MQKYLLAYLLLFACSQSMASDKTTGNRYIPKSTSIFQQLGDRNVEIKIEQYGDVSDLVFINVHDDESTSVNAAKALMETNGGLFIKIENDHKRNIKFKLEGRIYTFDPNQIFSRAGIIRSLAIFGKPGDKAIAEIEKLAVRILQLIPEQTSCIIALHNNTDGNFSVLSYTAGMEREKDTKALYINPQEDPDDIFLTTDSSLFYSLAAKQYNIILQDNNMVNKDGSLSVYFGERNVCYLNCETQHGKEKKYQEMIFDAYASIAAKKTAAVLYSFRMQAQVPEQFIQNDNVLFCDGRKVGVLKAGNKAAFTGYISGKLEFDRDFRFCSNMSIVLVDTGTGEYQLEIQENPSEAKQPVKPGDAVIQIVLRG